MSDKKSEQSRRYSNRRIQQAKEWYRECVSHDDRAVPALDFDKPLSQQTPEAKAALERLLPKRN